MLIVDMIEELFANSKNSKSSKGKGEAIYQAMVTLLIFVLLVSSITMTNKVLTLNEKYIELKKAYDILEEERSNIQYCSSSDRGNGLTPKGFWTKTDNDSVVRRYEY